MKKILFLLAFCLVAETQAQFSNHTLPVGSLTRSYRQYLPSGFNPQTEQGLPLIIAFHGIGDNMTNFSNVGFDNIADTARFIVVYPQGTTNFIGQNAWNNGTLLSSSSDDIAFMNQLMDSMIVNYHVNPAKIYACGFSMGGIMSHHLVCALPNRIAAIASVAGTMSSSDITSCNPGRPVPVLHFHGTADATVPYDTNALPSLSLVPETMEFWQNNNGCGDSSVNALPDLVASDSITVDQIVYNTCGAPLEHWRENGAAHQWLYRPVNDIDATTEIWLFFRDKIHPSPSQLSITENASSEISVQVQQQQLIVSSSSPILHIRIMDLLGRVTEDHEVGGVSALSLPLSDVRQAMLVEIRTSTGTAYRKLLVAP